MQSARLDMVPCVSSHSAMTLKPSALRNSLQKDERTQRSRENTLLYVVFDH
jgi:hypothetical protein